MAEIDMEWQRRLTFAALEGASRIEFSWHRLPDGFSYALRSYDQTDTVIGDSSDSDILKARMSPLEALAERDGFADDLAVRSISLDLSSQTLTRSW